MKLNAISMLKTFPLWGLFGLLLLLPVSCIRDDLQPCPPLSVQLVVKDKNYFNIDYVKGMDTKRAENLPFKDYVPSLFYRVENLETGELMEEREISQIDSEDELFELPIYGASLPHGRFVVTVWGGLKQTDALSEDRQILNLHPEHLQGEDIYLTCDTLTYDYLHSNYIFDLERVKGKLIIKTEGLEGRIQGSEMKADPVNGQAMRNYHYKGETSVVKIDKWKSDEAQYLSKTLLAPSCYGYKTTIRIGHQKSQGTDYMDWVPKDIHIPILRNQISVLKYVFHTDGSCSIFILMNDAWKEVHDMDVED